MQARTATQTNQHRGKLGKHDVNNAATEFACSRYQILRVWKRYKQQKADGVDFDLRNRRFQNSGRKGIDTEKILEILETVPLKNRTTQRALANEVLLEPLLREADLVCKSPLGGAVFQRHGLKDLEYLLRVDAFAAGILEPPVAEVDVDTVSLLLLVALPHAQDLVPGACKLCGRVVHVVLAEFAIIAALE